MSALLVLNGPFRQSRTSAPGRDESVAGDLRQRLRAGAKSGH